MFQSTPPRGGRRRGRVNPSHQSSFNPRPPRGGRHGKIDSNITVNAMGFNPRPRAGATLLIHSNHLPNVQVFQSTPRVGGDTFSQGWTSAASWTCFNPRPPRGGATSLCASCNRRRRFNPRPPRGGRRRSTGDAINFAAFVSIHAPARGRRRTLAVLILCRRVFQSTPPAGGATTNGTDPAPRHVVSIHAPRAGGDARSRSQRNLDRRFQSTPPARGATPVFKAQTSECFNPRPPRGGRHCARRVLNVDERFNPRPPRGGDGPARLS